MSANPIVSKVFKAGMLWCLDRDDKMEMQQLDKAVRHFERKYKVAVGTILMNKEDYRLIDVAITRAAFGIDEQTAKNGMVWNGIIVKPDTHIAPRHLHVYAEKSL